METLSSSEVTRFLGGFRSMRDRVLALLMVGAGLRCEEAARARVGDFRGRVWFVPCGKGGRSRTAIVRPEFRDVLGRMCEGRPADGLVAPNAVGGVSDLRNVRRAFRRASGWSGVECHPHLLRHTYAVALARVLPLVYVQRSLGHARATTTDIYLRGLGHDTVAEEGARLLEESVA